MLFFLPQNNIFAYVSCDYVGKIKEKESYQGDSEETSVNMGDWEYFYFELVQLYGDAIIVKKPLDVTDPELKTARNDRSEVIDFAIEDLEAAAELLPKFSELSTEDNGRISQEGCWAFLSRVALYEGTWQKSRGNAERGKAGTVIAQ